MKVQYGEYNMERERVDYRDFKKSGVTGSTNVKQINITLYTLSNLIQLFSK